MRKVYAGLFSSIDGVVGAPNERRPGFDEEMGAALQRMLEEQYAVLRGTPVLWRGDSGCARPRQRVQAPGRLDEIRRRDKR